MSLVPPILDHCTVGWWRGPFLLDDACGVPGLLGPGCIALGHIPFYRAIECCDQFCPDPSNCPPQTRDRFEQAIRLDTPQDAAAPMRQPDQPNWLSENESKPAPVNEAQPANRSASSVAKLGEVLPVRREVVTNVTRTITRFVTPAMPGRFIDLVV